MQTHQNARWWNSDTARMGAMLGVFGAAATYNAWVRPLWFDELSTLFMVARPTLRVMLQAIPTDGNPPLYFLLVRLLFLFHVKPEFALRLPAVLAYLASAAMVYWFVRHALLLQTILPEPAEAIGPGFALLSMSLFLGSGMAHYAVEGRAYSLLMACTMFALCCWQRYCRSGSKVALAGMAAGLCAAILTHQYGIVYAALPLGAGEVVRNLGRHPRDYRVLALILASSTLLAVTYPPMLKAQRPLLSAIEAAPVFTLGPEWRDLLNYREMVPHFVPLVASLALLVLLLQAGLGRTPKPQGPAGSPAAEFAAAAALALMLPAMLLATRLGTGYFQVRYGIGSSLGVSMLIGLSLARTRWRQTASIARVTTLYSIAMGVLTMWLTARPVDPPPWSDPVFLAAGRAEPIVVASALEFSPLWWYDPEDRGRIHYLADAAYAGSHSDLVPEFSLAIERPFTPMQMEDYAGFVATHRRFWLYSSGQLPIEWITRRLIEEGWHLHAVASATNAVLSFKEGRQTRTLYLVTR